MQTQIHNDEIEKLKTRILSIENSIESLIDRIIEADSATSSYINQKIKKLDWEKSALLQQISKLEEAENSFPDFKVLNNVMSVWDKLSFDDKRDVIEIIVDKIVVYPERVEIVWKF